MSPDINVAGDANIGGDLVGRDKHTTRVSDEETRQDLRDLAALIGKLQSDMVSVRLQVAILTTELGAVKERQSQVANVASDIGAQKERQLYGHLANAAYTTILGAIVLVVALLTK